MADLTQAEKAMEKALDPEGAKRRSWSGFVEGDVVAFFDANELEKLTLEDGKGNKAKLTRIKDNGIKIEYTSSIVL